MKPIIVMSTLLLICFFGTIAYEDKKMRQEILPVFYEKIELWRKNYPKLENIIREKLLDGKIDHIDFQEIKEEKNNLKIQRIKEKFYAPLV